MYLKTNIKPGDANSFRSCQKKLSVKYLFFFDILYKRRESSDNHSDTDDATCFGGRDTTYICTPEACCRHLQGCRIFLFDYPEYVGCKQYKDHDKRLSVTQSIVVTDRKH